MFIPSNRIDIYIRLEILPGSKLSSHFDTLTEASSLLDELNKEGEIQNKQQFWKTFDKFHTQEMKLPSKILKQIAFNTRSKVEVHMLIVLDKSLHEEHLTLPLQNQNKLFKVAITFITVFNGSFDVTISNNKPCFAKSITDKDGFTQISIPPRAYEIESLDNEIKRIVTEEGYFTEATHPKKTRPNFSTSGSIMENFRQEPLLSFLPDDSIRDLLGFNASTIYEE